jgi:hypothetical protein
MPRSSPLNQMLLLVLLAFAPLASLHAEGGCGDFTWDVAREHALFASAPSALSAATSPAAAPRLKDETLFEIVLTEASKVNFAVAPGKSPPADGLYAGLLRLTAASAGVYRVSLDQSVWVDVVADGAALRARDFQGRSGCDAPHKIVEFALPANASLILQLSGARSQRVRIAVTRAPMQP